MHGAVSRSASASHSTVPLPTVIDVGLFATAVGNRFPTVKPAPECNSGGAMTCHLDVIITEGCPPLSSVICNHSISTI